MCFLLLFIIICSYFISGFGAGSIYYVYYFFILLNVSFLYIDEYEYSCCLACRGFCKPVLAHIYIWYYNHIICIFFVSVFKYMYWSKAK